MDVSKTMLSGVKLEKVNEGGNDSQVETFCVIPSRQGDLTVSSSKKYIYIQTDDGTKIKIEIPKMVDAFKAIYNLGHCL